MTAAIEIPVPFSIEVDGVKSTRPWFAPPIVSVVDVDYDFEEVVDRQFQWRPGMPVLRFGGVS